MLNGLMQPVIGMSNPPLTIIVRVQLGNSGHSDKGGHRHRHERPLSAKKPYPSISHILSSSWGELISIFSKTLPKSLQAVA
jgi:hypothetical protein